MIGTPTEQAMDSSVSTYQYTIARSGGPCLVVLNNAYTNTSSSVTVTHTITGEYESLLPDISTTAGVRLAAFVVQYGSDSVVWTESTTWSSTGGLLYNRAFIYPLSGDMSAFEGEVAHNGRLVRQTSLTVTGAGTYDTTLNDEVVVDPVTATLIAHDNGVFTAPSGYDSIGQITVAVNGANSGTVDLDDVYYYAPDFTVLAPDVTTGTYTSGGHAVYAA